MVLQQLQQQQRRCVLEVERKFRSLAVRELTREGGVPHFRSLRKLPVRDIHDAYYDTTSRLLSANGAWVRKRNGEWEAKIKKGGNFNNSMFEEVRGADDVLECVRKYLGAAQADGNEVAPLGGGSGDTFGLRPTAVFSTHRETWVADDEFVIVYDTMDFGHEVGEVELQREVLLDACDEPGSAAIELQKQQVMKRMDESIAAFMRQYSWVFTPGEPRGKLTAYFEMIQKQGQRGGHVAG